MTLGLLPQDEPGNPLLKYLLVKSKLRCRPAPAQKRMTADIDPTLYRSERS